MHKPCKISSISNTIRLATGMISGL